MINNDRQKKESLGQSLWEDWLRLHDSSAQKLSEQLTQMWGWLYWKQQEKFHN